MSSKDRFLAVALFVLSALLYSANLDVLPSQDAMGSLRIATQLLSSGRVSVTPSDSPRMFVWQNGAGEALRGAPPSMDSSFNGKPVREAYRNGELKVVDSEYYLVATERREASGETQYVNTFGMGTVAFAVSVLLPLRLVYGDLREHMRVAWRGAKATATLCVAGSVLFVFLAALALTSRQRAFALASCYAFGTCVWSTSSQTLYQHGPNELCLAAGAWAFLAQSEKKWGVFLAGAAFGAAAVCRPSSVLFGLVLFAWLMWKERDQALRFALGATPFALFIASYDTWFFGAPWRTGQSVAGAIIAQAKTGSPSVFQTPPWVGLSGLLLSPSRGLLVFSPFLVASVYGAYRAFKEPGLVRLRALVLAALACMGLESMHFDWWGGWSYGYRHIVDLVVVFAIALAPALEWITANTLRKVGFGALVFWSVGVQIVGALSYDVVGWNNLVEFTIDTSGGRVAALGEDAAPFVEAGGQIVKAAPLDIDRPEYRGRLWSLSDNEIEYYFVNFASARQRRGELVEVMLNHGE